MILVFFKTINLFLDYPHFYHNIIKKFEKFIFKYFLIKINSDIIILNLNSKISLNLKILIIPLINIYI